MSLSNDNLQVYVTLPKELVSKIDKDAKTELRTRSKQIAKIITDYYQKEDN